MGQHFSGSCSSIGSSMILQENSMMDFVSDWRLSHKCSWREGRRGGGVVRS